jgi:hypothetical protein
MKIKNNKKRIRIKTMGLLTILAFLPLSCIWIKARFSHRYFRDLSLENRLKDKDGILYWTRDKDSTDFEKAFMVANTYLPDYFFKYEPNAVLLSDSAIGPHNTNLLQHPSLTIFMRQKRVLQLDSLRRATGEWRWW